MSNKFLLPRDRDKAIAAILKAPDGMQVVIDKPKRKRSYDQNNKFHAAAQELAQITGYTLEQVKDWVKHEIGAYEYVEIGGKKIKRYKSSAQFSVVEMSGAIIVLEEKIAWSS